MDIILSGKSADSDKRNSTSEEKPLPATDFHALFEQSHYYQQSKESFIKATEEAAKCPTMTELASTIKEFANPITKQLHEVTKRR